MKRIEFLHKKNIDEMKKHIQTRFYKFILEKYGKQKEDITDEETNIPDEEIIDEIENDEVLKDKNDEVKTKKNEDELDLDELIEEYNKLTNKYKKIKNDNSHYRRK
ncbi:MAG: hypothetical protein ACOYLP_02770 [Flavobacterium sp.]|jgi:hypothetical protein